MADAALAVQATNGATVNAADRLIVALDFPTVAEAAKLVDELGDQVSFYKIGLHLQLVEGLFGFAQDLRAKRKKIFLDFKYIDISDTIEAVISRASEMGIEFVTVYQSPLAIEAALRVQKADRPKILTVTLLTDRDQSYIKEEYNMDISVSDFVVRKAVMVARAKGNGVICSPNEVYEIRKAIKDPKFLIVTPGIRPEWSLSGGHKRAGTPSQAIECGADYLVVGRPIIRATNRRDAASRVIDEMQTSFEKRRYHVL